MGAPFLLCRHGKIDRYKIMNRENNNKKKSKTAQSEESVLSFWEENKIFEKTLEKESPKGEFVFYDGPPFATGLPHYGHLLAGTIKDIIPRYKTMQGYHVPRKWGWDCHGLPIENLIEKELGLETKKDIEEYGIEKFNMAARNSVLRYENEWKRYVPRSGRFIDMDNAYMAMDSSYMESIWWVFGQLHKKGLTKEGFKVMHLCPRCETTLANFEVNQGYKDVTDISLTAKFELVDEPGTFMLAWTTTPWTLPGNVALAVGADIDYVKVQETGMSTVNSTATGTYDSPSLENYFVSKIIFLKNSHEIIEGSGHYKWDEKPNSTFEIVEEIKGSELAGKKYIAPFDYYQNDPEVENTENGWQVLLAEFVTVDSGTGIVHIAPAFGTDDMQLGEIHDLPFVQHVAKSGAFKHVFAETIDGGDFAGMLVKQKNDLMSTDIEIIKRLAHDGKLFSKKKLIHSYPHCWRCDTPLLNYATTSWYVDVPSIKDKLIASNEKVNWVPEHVGQGRFGKWLDGARDWALSRSRFWGTPLPVWQSSDAEEIFVAGSFEEMLDRVKTSGNTYFGLRHGESISNTTGIINADVTIENGLTELGREQANSEADQLPKDIDYVFVSPLQRTQETATIIKKQLGLSDEQIIVDERLRERNPGSEWEGKSWHDAHAAEESQPHSDFWNYTLAEDAESIGDVYQRIMEFMFDLETNYHNKKIVIISHGGVLKTIQFGLKYYGEEKKALKFFYETKLPGNASVLHFDFKPFPHREGYVIDIHRPYIDDVIILSETGEEMKRVPDVFDVWFDSASMPYAQQHYPFENKESFESAFPAQFIAEGLDQTRGWFYVMTVIGNALFDTTPFENVIVNGLILAEDGKKMSKSLKNYPDPYDMFDSAGADAIRLYMINSPVVRAEEFAFTEKGVREVASKVMGRLRNIVSLYEMYKDDVDGYLSDSEHVLDQWIMARLAELENDVRKGLENYELDRAARPIFDFVDDFSTWYIRRSRDRFKVNSNSVGRENALGYKGDGIEDKKRALGTTRKVLMETAKIIAPFVPFVAEEIWQTLRVGGMPESVHLTEWSEMEIADAGVVEMMQKVRDLISEGLQLRSEAKIKVRQPLQSLTASLDGIDESCYQLILDELNIKQVIEGELSLDTHITDELKSEGNMRELLRQIQSLRKSSGLEAHDLINLIIQTSPEGQQLMETFSDEIKSTAGVKEFNFTHNDGEEITVEDMIFIVAIEKE
jgi:isoleucyl-tRNA synthetase